MLGFDFNKNLSLDYLAISIRSLVLSMVGMFIPIYILTLGYSFNELIIYYLFIMFFVQYSVTTDGHHRNILLEIDEMYQRALVFPFYPRRDLFSPHKAKDLRSFEI